MLQNIQCAPVCGLKQTNRQNDPGGRHQRDRRYADDIDMAKSANTPIYFRLVVSIASFVESGDEAVPSSRNVAGDLGRRGDAHGVDLEHGHLNGRLSPRYPDVMVNSIAAGR